MAWRTIVLNKVVLKPKKMRPLKLDMRVYLGKAVEGEEEILKLIHSSLSKRYVWLRPAEAINLTRSYRAI